MSSSTISVCLPAHLLAFVEEEAKKFDLSIEEWLLHELEVQHKLQQETNEFLAARRKDVSHEEWEEIMAKAPNVPPMPGDELH